MPSPRVVLLARLTSRIFGWIYTIAWSLSFYPQPILNVRRRSTIGSSISFQLLNVLGFIAYSLETIALYSSPLIRAQYAARDPVSPVPPIHSNDVAFAAHGAVLTVAVLSMYFQRIWGFDQDGGRQGKWRVGILLWGFWALCLLYVIWTAGLVLIEGGDWGKDPNRWAWIDVVYVLGHIKLVVSVAKYIPQVMSNYRRQSTTGWSIDQILLDVTGGIFSNAQLLIDCSLQNDWSGISGNSTKLGLACITLFFDFIFLVQHYILYRGNDRAWEGERAKLLEHDVESSSYGS